MIRAMARAAVWRWRWRWLCLAAVAGAAGCARPEQAEPALVTATPLRSRAVRDPRAVLKEFGVEVPDSVRIDVWDSTADLRYMVLPQRPAGSEGLDEEALAELVTRNSMIGTDRELNAPGR